MTKDEKEKGEAFERPVGALADEYASVTGYDAGMYESVADRTSAVKARYASCDEVVSQQKLRFNDSVASIENAGFADLRGKQFETHEGMAESGGVAAEDILHRAAQRHGMERAWDQDQDGIPDSEDPFWGTHEPLPQIAPEFSSQQDQSRGEDPYTSASQRTDEALDGFMDAYGAVSAAGFTNGLGSEFLSPGEAQETDDVRRPRIGRYYDRRELFEGSGVESVDVASVYTRQELAEQAASASYHAVHDGTPQAEFTSSSEMSAAASSTFRTGDAGEGSLAGYILGPDGVQGFAGRAGLGWAASQIGSDAYSDGGFRTGAAALSGGLAGARSGIGFARGAAWGAADDATRDDTALHSVVEIHQTLDKGRRIGRLSRGIQSFRARKRGAAGFQEVQAKRRSMAIAKGVREGRVTEGMSAGQRAVATKNGLVAAAKAGVKRSGGGILAALSGAAAPALITLLVIFLIVIVVGTVSNSDRTTADGLTGNEQVVAQYLLDKGLNAVQVSAIIGNMVQESGVSPTSINASSGAFGLCQWLGSRKTALQQLSAIRGVPMTDITVQLDYLWSELTCAVTGGWNQSEWETFQGYSETGQLSAAVELFARRFERAGEGEINMDRRLTEAQRVYESLTRPTGSGQEYQASSEQQKAIVDACHTTPSPGKNYCAAWVSRVYQNAGLGYIGGNACDMYWKYCWSSNMDDLKVGMIVAVPSHNHDSAGMRWGHVAIYIGDGQVMENVGSIQTRSLESWMSYYGTTYPVKWGFAGGVAAN